MKGADNWKEVHNSVKHYVQMINTRYYKTAQVRDPFKVEGKPMGFNITKYVKFTDIGLDSCNN